MLISDEFRPIRTFDPLHQATTAWSTSWVDLMQHDNVTPSKMRHTIFGSLASGALNAKARDLLYRVLADSLPLGPVRCPRKDETKGVCSLCLLLRGERCTETARHLFLECPYTQSVLGAVCKAFTCCTGTPAQRARARDMTCGEVCSYHGRSLVTGLVLNDAGTGVAKAHEAFQSLIGVTSQAILDRQRHNADATRPLSYELKDIWTRITERFAVVARGGYQRAAAEESRIQIKFDGWLPDVPPTKDWEKKWSDLGVVQWAGRKLTCSLPAATDIPGLHGEPTDQRNSPQCQLRLLLRGARARLERAGGAFRRAARPAPAAAPPPPAAPPPVVASPPPVPIAAPQMLRMPETPPPLNLNPMRYIACIMTL